MNRYCMPPTTKRVAYRTCKASNLRIRAKTLQNINKNKVYGDTILTQKMEALNHEWDIERVLETNAATMVLISSLFGLYQKKRCWFLLTGTVGFLLLQHALQGWCPPLPIFRKIGVRTAEEINNEKMVYKKIRGDFTKETEDSDQLLEMAEK